MKDVLRLGICLLGLAWASAVHSVVMVPFTIETLAERAQLVVHGIVSSTTCQRDDAGRNSHGSVAGPLRGGPPVCHKFWKYQHADPLESGFAPVDASECSQSANARGSLLPCQ